MNCAHSAGPGVVHVAPLEPDNLGYVPISNSENDANKIVESVACEDSEAHVSSRDCLSEFLQDSTSSSLISCTT